jgi:hypothetical protein
LTVLLNRKFKNKVCHSEWSKGSEKFQMQKLFSFVLKQKNKFKIKPAESSAGFILRLVYFPKWLLRSHAFVE